MKFLRTATFAAFVALLCAAQPSEAALRGTAQAANTAAATSISVDVSTIGIIDGDVLLCDVVVGGTNLATFTFPSGFAIPSGLSTLAINDIDGNNTMSIEYLTVSGTPPTSVTITSSTSNLLGAQCRDYSGRNTATPFEAVAQTSSTVISSGKLPLTGVAIASGDDVAVFAGFNNALTVSGVTYTFGVPSPYTDVLTTFGNVKYGILMGSADDPNAAAASASTINSTITWSSGSSPPSGAGYVLALAPSGSSCAHEGYTSGGALAVPNGSTGSYWLANGTLGTPNCSTVEYWQPTLGKFGVQ